MRSIISKHRFAAKWFDVLAEAPHFERDVAHCLLQLREVEFADMLTMFGPHGLAALARVLLELRNADDEFDGMFLLLAEELTCVLRCAADTFTTTPSDEVTFDTVANALKSRADFNMGAVTAALHEITGSTAIASAHSAKRKAKPAADSSKPEAGSSKRPRMSND